MPPDRPTARGSIGPTALMFRDELIGFARSRVMLVLWVVLPLLAIGGYLLVSGSKDLGTAMGGPDHQLSAAGFITLLLSSLAGTVAALMVAVDLVSERQRKVYELFVIRPVRPEVILWAKFAAVTGCVVVACVVSMAAAVALDAARGQPITGRLLHDLLKSLVSLIGVISLSAAVGMFFGVVARSILVAVILILYVGQNLAVVPMLPVYLGVLPDLFWLIMVITAVLVGVVLWLSGVMFRRAEL